MIEFEPNDRIGYDELLAQIYKKLSLDMIYLKLNDYLFFLNEKKKNLKKTQEDGYSN